MIQLHEAIAGAKARHYRDGLRDGVVLALEMLLGHDRHGGVPYNGPMPEELRQWAERALAKARTS